MNRHRRFLAVVFLLGLGCLNVLVYMSFHFQRQAVRKAGNYRKKIEILERGLQFYPFNEQIFRELGRTYFDLGLDDLVDIEQRDFGLEKSAENLIRATWINPGEYMNHLFLAQALLYKNYFFSEQTDYFEELKRAARLTNHDETVYYEVGKAMLLQWDELSAEDRQYGLDLVKSSSNLKNRQRVQDLLQTWALAGADYEVIRAILPKDTSVYRLYANFLAEKSMSLEERQKVLVEVEFLEFETARRLFREGMESYRRYRLKEAQGRFKSSLRLLNTIYFYQNLLGRTDIDTQEWIELKRGLHLNLLKTSVDMSAPVSEVMGHLKLYLEVEKDEVKAGEVEDFLLEKNFVSSEGISPTEDTERLYCRLALDYIKHRYRGIITIGERLKDRFILPESNDRKYIEIYKIIADSYQGLDFLYDAADYYEKILLIDTDNLPALLSSLKNYERLNNEEQLRRIQRRIGEVIAPAILSFRGERLGKGSPFGVDFLLRDESIALEVDFQFQDSIAAPLVQLVFNGRVVWEKYVEENVVQLELDSRIGDNHLQLVCLNRDIGLNQIKYVIK